MSRRHGMSHLSCARLSVQEVPSFSPAFLENRILGGWLGRAAGCLLGKPVEKIPRHGIKEMLLSNGTWPLTDYITETRNSTISFETVSRGTSIADVRVYEKTSSA